MTELEHGAIDYLGDARGADRCDKPWDARSQGCLGRRFPGVTIAAMVFVNNPAVGPPYLYKQLSHVPWQGWTFADTIFPAFVLLIGVSASLGPKPRSLRRACRRDLVLLAAGLALNAAPLVFTGQGAIFVIDHVRIMGVLQRIAIADFAATLAMMWLRPRDQLFLAGALLGGYWAVLSHVAVPGHGAGLLTPTVNLPGWVDRQLFGVAHMYPAAAGGYDPEGLLGCISATAAVLLGAGDRSRVDEKRTDIDHRNVAEPRPHGAGQQQWRNDAPVADGANARRRSHDDGGRDEGRTLVAIHGVPHAGRSRSEVLSPRLVTVVDAARLLGIGRSTLYELIAEGDIDLVHIGRSARVPISSLDRFVATLQSPERAERPSTSATVRCGLRPPAGAHPAGAADAAAAASKLAAAERSDPS